MLWTFDMGKRSFVKRGSENVPLRFGEWHDLAIVLKGTALQGKPDGRPLLEHTLAAPVSRRVGLWSKTDSFGTGEGGDERGGGWDDDARALRLSYRGRADPGIRYRSFGFRCVRDSAPSGGLD